MSARETRGLFEWLDANRTEAPERFALFIDTLRVFAGADESTRADLQKEIESLFEWSLADAVSFFAEFAKREASGPIDRAEVRRLVSRAVSELDDKDVLDDLDTRHLVVEKMLSAVDWGRMPLPVVRAVFDVIVSSAPAELLCQGARGEEDGLAGEAAGFIASNEQIRAELHVLEAPATMHDLDAGTGAHSAAIPVVEAVDVAEMKAWEAAGNVLRVTAPNAYAEFVAEVQRYTAIEDPTEADDAQHEERMQRIKTAASIESAGPHVAAVVS